MLFTSPLLLWVSSFGLIGDTQGAMAKRRPYDLALMVCWAEEVD